MAAMVKSDLDLAIDEIDPACLRDVTKGIAREAAKWKYIAEERGKAIVELQAELDILRAPDVGSENVS